MRVAVVLMLKDEAAEILPWLGWYFGLGVDTIVVFDDSSTDGTAELLEQAAVTSDVRLTRLAPTNESFTNRQQAAYAAAMRRYADEFDWIGFFDADEYLALYAHPDVHAFLDRPSDIGSVMVHWCNYSSGNNVFRPASFPFVAYQTHYEVEEGVNRHVKSFVRPRLWTGQWQNVHVFDTGHRNVDATGRDIVWSATTGITATAPDWSVAKLMHYQCRSMEHFIDRMRKRDDLVPAPRAFTDADRGGEHDDRPLARERAVRDWVFAALLGVPPALPGVLRGLAAPVADPATPSIDTASRPRLPAAGWLGRLRAALGAASPASELAPSPPPAIAAAPASDRVEILLPLTWDDRRICFDADAGRLRILSEREDGPDTLHAVRLAHRPDRLFLLRLAACDAPLVAQRDGRLAAALGLDIVPLDNARVALRHPTTRRYLCAVPPQISGDVVLDRRFIKEWETFSLHAVERTRALTVQPAIAFLDRVAAAADRPAVLAASLGSGEARLAMALLPVWLELLDDVAAARVRTCLGQGFCAMVT